MLVRLCGVEPCLCVRIALQGVAALHNNPNFTHLNLSECGELTDTGVEVSFCVLQVS